MYLVSFMSDFRYGYLLIFNSKIGNHMQYVNSAPSNKIQPKIPKKTSFLTQNELKIVFEFISKNILDHIKNDYQERS